jgi:uncharacterized protein YceK
MKKILLLIVFLIISGCSVGHKCTYTQEGTKISSWVWFTKDIPADLHKDNCN